MKGRAMFDARAYYATLELPVFIAPNGKQYTGRIIGADTWSRMQSKLRMSKVDGVFEPRGLEAAMKIICNETFPPNWFKPWEKTVWNWVCELPQIGKYRAVWDFMRSQAKARGETLPENLGTLSTPLLPLDKQDGLLEDLQIPS